MFLNEEEKRRLCLNHVKPFDVAAVRISGLVNLVFSRQTGVVECGFPFGTRRSAIGQFAFPVPGNSPRSLRDG